MSVSSVLPIPPARAQSGTLGGYDDQISSGNFIRRPRYYGIEDESVRLISDQIALPCRGGTGLGFATRRRVQPIAFYPAWRATFRSNQGDWPYATEHSGGIGRKTHTRAPRGLQWSTAQHRPDRCPSASNTTEAWPRNPAPNLETD